MAEGDSANAFKKLDKHKDVFSRAAQHVQGHAGSLASDQLLYLYARYKQALEGPCKVPRPAFYDPKGRQKWDAWSKLGDMAASAAMDEYVKFVCQLFPDWDPGQLSFHKQCPEMQATVCEFFKEETSGARSMLGAVVSRPCGEPVVAPEQKDAFDWTKEGSLDRLRECLNDGSVIDMRDTQKMSMLHWACDRGHLEVVRLLLDKGADPEAKDVEGQTPLHYASSCGHLQVAELLLERGAQRSTKDDEGQTPAEVALSPELEALLSPS